MDISACWTPCAECTQRLNTYPVCARVKRPRAHGVLIEFWGIRAQRGQKIPCAWGIHRVSGYPVCMGVLTPVHTGCSESRCKTSWVPGDDTKKVYEDGRSGRKAGVYVLEAFPHNNKPRRPLLIVWYFLWLKSNQKRNPKSRWKDHAVDLFELGESHTFSENFMGPISSGKTLEIDISSSNHIVITPKYN